MTRFIADVAIIGSSFAGSLLALCLRRQGIDVVLLDKQKHPRFALGESSTPAADMVLAALCDRYDLPRLKPLTRYGTWKQARPELRCGPKRGFSYFHHRRGEPFVPDDQHSNELLVTASAADEVSDTNWYRADVDAFFAAEAVAAGAVLLEEAHVAAIEHAENWSLSGSHDGRLFELRAGFLIDSSGLSAVLPRRLGLADLSDDMETSSRSIYAHLTGLRRWRDMLAEMGGRTEDHPFDCDAAALHHILDGAWMWVLPFDGGITSVGLVLDPRRHPRSPDLSPADEWQLWLGQYPSISDQLGTSQFVRPFHDVRGTSRLQRLWDVPASASEQGWVLLPGTHGFIDAFFSTGIAHSMIGIERIAAAFEMRDQPDHFHALMREHIALTARELKLVDRLVAASHATFGRHPDLLAGVAMLYFAAATTWERRRTSGEGGRVWLLADDMHYIRIVDDSIADLRALLPHSDDAVERRRFTAMLAERISAYNTAGLCDPTVHNMYRYTAADKAIRSPA